VVTRILVVASNLDAPVAIAHRDDARLRGGIH
jgi:hypothetical protein